MTVNTSRVACAAMLLAVAGCGGNPAPKGARNDRVPNVTGLRLDDAERRVGEIGLEYYVYADDEVIIRTNWTVCSQHPAAGAPAADVELYVQHFSCEDDDDDD